ncbi:FadR/GntR family transcriptional regulator [Pelagibius sp. Alg239-R121]|uniref:FadR/GntR family transcriptional regulator n=1 Tax=Pelagibius sp. Alg239-R121 TaxID=2993448 RepID=UPI0024A65076|nr:FadR/GntR family transcriptional regulator [Pelagibius sp. Alg239-R121]
MPLKAIETERLYQQVARQIADLIRSGEWKVGERLPPERDLSVTLGVSRPTVREAMVALELAQLVEVRSGAGIYIRDSSSSIVASLQNGIDTGPSPFDLIAARRVIEGEIAAIAASQITKPELNGIADAIRKMETDIEAGQQEISSHEDGDLMFHVRLAEATRNTVLASLVEPLWEGMRKPMFAAISRRVSLPDNARRAAKEHWAIHANLTQGDAEGARAAMHAHLDTVRRMLLKD